MAAILVGAVVTVIAAWLVLIVVLVVARPDGATLTDAARVLPDTVGMLRRLVRDPEVPRPARVTASKWWWSRNLLVLCGVSFL